MKPTLLCLQLFAYSLFVQGAFAVDASPAAKALVSDLAIRESREPLANSPDWQKPGLVILVSSRMGPRIGEDILAELKSAADGAELLIVNDIAEAGEKIRDAEVLMGSCTLVSSGMQKLRWVQHFSAGVENCLRNEAMKQSAASLSNMKGVYGPGIAEHVIALMFNLSRGLHRFQQEQAKANWNRPLAMELPMLELKGKTLLVVGLGGIGSEIAWRAHGLGMRVIATRNSSRRGPDYVDKVGLAEDLLAFAAEADVIVNATPLTTATTHLFDRAFFQEIKPSAYFINIGRGRSVVTAELLAALEEGRLAGAGLDVVDPEPLAEDHPLWRAPNVIITPHISGRSDQVANRFWIFVRENLRRYVQGEKLLNVVNMDRGY